MTSDGLLSPAKLAKPVLGDLKAKNEQFSWRSVENPLVMGTNTKYKYDLVSSMGISASYLVEIKGFVFQINKQKFVLGYVSDWSEDGPTNRRRFDVGKGFADNAAGCNAVVTALNSVTKEFKEAKQYCFLSALGAPK
jgi:hypothetical protein